MFRKLAAVAAATTILAMPATASTYSATSAVGSNSDHSIWLFAFGRNSNRDFDFDPAGIFTTTDDGASLTGTVVADGPDWEGGFEVSFDYSNDLSAYNDSVAFKSENGSTQAADTYFMTLAGGSLVGFGDFAGSTFSVEVAPTPSEDGYAVQVGTGANNKNDYYGLANWFTLDAGSCATDFCLAADGTRGDVNLDLQAVPLPASGLLLMAGLGGLAVTRRRKSNT
ncbi:MAG: VPLPA-CTERM sorting domain-containing protein [Roseobacter sp.]